MSIHVIASNDTLLANLRSSAQQGDWVVSSATLRPPGQNLLPLLHAIGDGETSGIVLLDSPSATSGQDLSALESWQRQRPLLNVLLLSEDNSKSLLMRAMRAGVREVLPLPFAPQELQLSLQRWSAHAAAQTRPYPASTTPATTAPPTTPAASKAPGRLIAFMGCKGGNGTSFVAANMAHIMASEFNRQCAFVDLDLQCGDASFYLGSGANKHTLSDLTRQIGRLDAQLLSSCLHPVTPQLNLLAAPNDLETAMTIGAPDIEKVLNLARSLHDHVVVDLPRTLNALTLKVLDMADVVYIVMQSQTPDVRDAQRLVSTLRSLGFSDNKFRLLVNRYKPAGWVSLEELEKVVGLKVNQTIPSNHQWVGESLHTGKPLSAVHDHNTVLKALRETTCDLLGMQPHRHRHWIPRWLSPAA